MVKVGKSFRIDLEDYIFLEKLAKERGLSLSALIRVIIRTYISHIKKGNWDWLELEYDK